MKATSVLIQRLRALVPSREKLEATPCLRRLTPYLAHPKLWHWSRRSIAAGVAIGLFFGLLIPIAQIPFASVAAIALRANLAVAVASTLITNPLTMAPIYYVAYRLGAWVTGSTTAKVVSFSGASALWENITTICMPLFAGLGIMAIVSSLVGYLLITQVWAWHIGKKRSARA